MSAPRTAAAVGCVGSAGLLSAVQSVTRSGQLRRTGVNARVVGKDVMSGGTVMSRDPEIANAVDKVDSAVGLADHARHRAGV